jgi:hypothetical protein
MPYTIEVHPKIAPGLWQSQYPGDTPKLHATIKANSPGIALEIMRKSIYGDCPMRIVSPL